MAESAAPLTRNAAPPELERRLGAVDAAAVIVANVIGGGILFTPPLVAAGVPHALLFLAAWAAGGVLAFAGAMAYAELAALRPRAGGEYVYLREAFGPLLAFLTGWTSFVAGFSGAIATSAAVFAIYLGRFVPQAGSEAALFTLPVLPGWLELAFSPRALTAIGLIALFSFIHLRGVGPGTLVSNTLAALKIGALVLFIVVGFSLGEGDVAGLAQTGAVAPSGFLLALIPVMFTYSGWNAASYIAEEISGPGRNVPRAFALGTAAVIAIYLLLNLLYLYVVPVDALAKVEGSVLDVVADRLLGARAGDIMAVIALISLSASVSAMTFAGPRVYFAMARDGLFFARAGAVHARYRTPANAIVAQASWSALLVLSAKADALVKYTGFAIMLFSGVAVASLFVLRSKNPDEPRPFRAWGYPVFPGVFAAAALLIVANALLGEPGQFLTGLAIIAAGLPLFLWMRRRG
jgi:APA family basic amino acid/polyamine antiporter